jgi:WD40 repeat protein
MGVPRNLQEARKWYQKAAAQGDQDARKRLDKLEKVKPPAKDPPKRLPDFSLFQMFRSKGGPIVALALSGKGTVKLYNERGEIGPLNGHTATVTCAAFTPDGTRGVTGSKDRTVRVWDIGKRQLIRRLKGHNNAVAAVAISADGKKAISADGSVVRVWDLRTGREVGRLPHELPVTCLGFLPGGSQVVCAVDTKDQAELALTLHVWSIATLRKTTALPSVVQYSAFAFTPDGLLVGGNKNGDVIQVSLPGRKTTINARSGPPNLQRVSFSADGRLVLFEAGTEVRVFSLPDKMRSVTSLVQKDATRGPYAASLDKDGANLTYADRNSDGTVAFKTMSTR